MFKYSRAPLIQINRDGEAIGYAKNPDNWNFSLKTGYTGILKFGCYYLQSVPASNRIRVGGEIFRTCPDRP
jgi:hypothetical protein